MGEHSVPQAYLRAFEDPRHPGMIWAYPREGPVRLLPIKNVAQSSGFYDPDVEVALHELVEAPANPVLSLLRDSRPIDPDEKRTLAMYIATLLKRVPHSRARAKALIPETLANTVSKLEQALISLGRRPGVAPGLLERRLQELEVAHERLAREIPPEVVAQIEDPWPSSRMIEAIHQMHWRY